MSGEYRGVGRRLPSSSGDLEVLAAGAYSTDTTSADETPMDSETSRGESPSPSFMYEAPITVGICAMNKKTMAQPMKNILSRLAQEAAIELVMFSDDTILNKPVEEWPICMSLIAFYSHGFPLEKAIEYVKLRKPLVLNDLQSQYALMDRRKVYEILMKNGVEVPRHMVVNRDGDGDEPQVVETDDLLEINGTAFHKPFVEKPIDAENHNIYIYFPSDYGGGAQRLFRKVKDRSSTYSKVSSIRMKGSFIYEEFMPTDGTDVKVYSVGPDYAHAEARKSPALDGKVERDENGKEIRYPVLLTAQEKLIARKVCLAFKQTVCGFDLLRANGKSYVCDVNGFSFVKNSQKYYNDCAQILLETIIGHIAPHYFPLMPPSVEYLAEEVPDLPVPIPVTNNTFELRCVVAVIRHGDRTPKQKMKMIVKHRRFFDLFKTFNGYEKGELKLKKPKELQMVLDISRDLLDEIEQGSDDEHEVEEKVHKLKQLKTVLEMYGTFSGINRKVQFKLITKRQGEPCHVLLLILKWGGELTPAGKKQAEEYGRTFRCMYPGGEGEYSSLPGSGFLRLHSTYRHDLKVYASDEGRVQMTAAAFTKGLLDLEGNLASVLVHLVKRDQAATNMLDKFTDAQDAMNTVKDKLHAMMRSEEDFNEDSYTELAPSTAESIVEALHQIKNPHQMCVRLHEMISQLLTEIREIARSNSNILLYQGETLDLMLKRWLKLEKDFRHKRGHFDISKIPDIYDCIKYDLLHNSDLKLKTAKELFNCVMPMADIVIPQEYGITVQDKVDIAQKICSPLLRKIQADFHHTIINEQGDLSHRLDPLRSKGVISPNRHVRTRLYFTSESHVHSLLNILQYGGLVKNPENDSRWSEAMDVVRKAPELNYMTQFVFMLFEDVRKPEDDADRYHVDIHFSPGIKGRREIIFEGSSALVTKSSPVLPEKTPQVFVKRLSHVSVVASSEAVAIKRNIDGSSTHLKKSSPEENPHVFVQRLSHGRVAESTTKPSASSSSSDKSTIVSSSQVNASSGVSNLNDVGRATIWDDLSMRYVMCSRSAAGVGRTLMSADTRNRKSSAPNIHFESLRSSSDTKLMDRSSKSDVIEEVDSCCGHTRRKKSASDSMLEPHLHQPVNFGISPPAQRSRSDGNFTEDGSPKLQQDSAKSSSESSPDFNKSEETERLHEHLHVSAEASLKGEMDKVVKNHLTHSMGCNHEMHVNVMKPSASFTAATSGHGSTAASTMKSDSPKKKKKPTTLNHSSKDVAHSHSSSSKTAKKQKRIHLSTEQAKEHSKSLTSMTISENKELDMKKWGSIEQLHDGFPGTLGLYSQRSMVERGLEMASELATQIEPLIHIASPSLMDVDTFLTGLTGIKLDYNIQQEPTWEQKRPNSAFFRHRSGSEEPGHKSPSSNSLGAPSRLRRYDVPTIQGGGGGGGGGGLVASSKCSPAVSPEYPISGANRGRDGSSTSRHRKSVGSIDTETFGMIKNHFPSPSESAGCPQPSTVVANANDDNAMMPCTTRTYSLDGSKYRTLWPEDPSVRSDNNHVGDGLRVCPSSGCDSMSISHLS